MIRILVKCGSLLCHPIEPVTIGEHIKKKLFQET